jgi:hypothetical protein
MASNPSQLEWNGVPFDQPWHHSTRFKGFDPYKFWFQGECGAAVKAQVRQISNWEWNSFHDQFRWEKQFRPLFLCPFEPIWACLYNLQLIHYAKPNFLLQNTQCSGIVVCKVTHDVLQWKYFARTHLQDSGLEYIWELSQFTRAGNTSPHLPSSASHPSAIWQHHTWSVIIYPNRLSIVMSLWGPTSSPHEMIAAFSIRQFNSSWSWKTGSSTFHRDLEA